LNQSKQGRAQKTRRLFVPCSSSSLSGQVKSGVLDSTSIDRLSVDIGEIEQIRGIFILYQE
jgi:hypothetical protein